MHKLLIAGAFALGVGFPVLASQAVAKGASAIASLDTDNDGTVDLAEANNVNGGAISGRRGGVKPGQLV